MDEAVARSYEVLGLGPGATLAEAKLAYRDLAKVWHPDRFATESDRLRNKAEDEFKRIKTAYEVVEQHILSQTSCHSRGVEPPSPPPPPNYSHQTREDKDFYSEPVSSTGPNRKYLWWVAGLGMTAALLVVSSDSSPPHATGATSSTQSSYQFTGDPALVARVRAELVAYVKIRNSNPSRGMEWRCVELIQTLRKICEIRFGEKGNCAQRGADFDESGCRAVDDAITRTDLTELADTLVTMKMESPQEAPVQVTSTTTSTLPTPRAKETAGYFTIGSSQEEVAEVQGTPTSMRNSFGGQEVWNYGLSSITFREGRVVQWSNISQNLRVELHQSGVRTGQSLTYFTRGSTRDDVLFVMGTPSTIRTLFGGQEVWNYGLSSVTFRSGRVVEWSNISNNLKVRMSTR